MYFGDVRSCLVVFVMLGAASALNVHRKCCAKDEILNDSVGCVKFAPGDEARFNATWDDLWWIPKNNAISGSLTLSRMNITYNSTPECYPLVVNSTGERLEFEVRVVKDDLLLDVISTGTLHDNATLRRRTFPSTAYCLDRGPQDLYIAVICPCEVMTCIRKCCGDGEFYNTTSNMCVEVDVEKYPDVREWDSRFKEVGVGLEYYRIANILPNCPNGYDVLRKSVKDMDIKELTWNFTADRTGHAKVASHQTRITTDEFCGDATLFPDGSVDDGNLLICLPRSSIKLQLYGSIFLIGGVALMLAVVVNLILPDQKLYDLLLLYHNLSLMVGYFTIGVRNLTMKYQTTLSCKIVSLIMQFSFLASFFWINVMCIDISWTFSGLRAPHGGSLERDRKKFICYSIYAWGSTATISIVTAILEFTPGIPDWVTKPEFGVTSCFFGSRMAMLAYNYGPIAFLLVENVVLFIYTAARIVSMRRETAILRKSGNMQHAGKYHKDMQNLNLYVKLFCLMGLSWALDIIGWWVGGPEYFWYFTDALNLLRPVFILIIFYCKRSVYFLVRARLSICCPRINPAKSVTNDIGHEISSTQQTALSVLTVNDREMPSPNLGRCPNSKVSTPNSPRKVSTTNSPADDRKVSPSALDSNPGERKMSTEVPEIAIP